MRLTECGTRQALGATKIEVIMVGLPPVGPQTTARFGFSSRYATTTRSGAARYPCRCFHNSRTLGTQHVQDAF